MADQSTSGLTRHLRVARVALLVCAFAAQCAAQTPVRLEQVNARRGADFTPVLEGRSVLIEATVASPAVPVAHYSHLAVHDDTGHGAVLEGSPQVFSAFQPGDRISVRGTVSRRAGLPVVVPSEAPELLSRGPAPSPRKLTLAEAQSVANMGLLVSVEGKVIRRGLDSGGEFLLIGDAENPLKVLLPLRTISSPARFRRIEAGDRVRVTGIASQRCEIPPFDRFFQVVVASDEAVSLVQKRWLVSPGTLVLCLGMLAAALGIWWIRERRMSAQRKMVRTLYTLGEETISAGSPAEIVRKLSQALPAAIKIAGIHLYLYNRAAKTLDRVQARSDAPAFAVPVYVPEGTLPQGPAVAFRNQAMLTITDTRRSPFFPDGRPEGRPRSVLFVPLFAEEELVGILEFYDGKPMHEFSPDEKVLAQHLANQIGIALRLMEEKSIREQLFRSEKLAAVGRLISGVAEELKSPIESISRLGESIVTAPPGTVRAEARMIAQEAQRASEIVARLVSLMQPAKAEAKRIDVNALVHSLIEFRRDQWSERGVYVRELLCPYPVYVLGSQGQLERVFLDLLIQAEQAMADAVDKTISVTSGLLARRVLVEISFPAAPSRVDGRQEQLPLPGENLTRGMITSHGGDMRMVHAGEGECRIEIELPVVATGADAAPDRPGKRQFTCLLVEPDRSAMAEVTQVLTSNGCRVIPATTAEEGVELVQRMRFDVVFCAIHLPGVNWVQFADIVRPNVGGFVLLTEGFEWELSRGLVSGDSYVLSKPIDTDQLTRLLNAIDAKLSEGRGLQIVSTVPKRAAK